MKAQSVIFLLLLTLLHLSSLNAQDRMLVIGTVTNSADDNKPITDPLLRIIAYNTVAEARDVKNKFDAWQSAGAFGAFEDFGLIVETTPDLGYYEIQAYPDGALLFLYESSEVPCQLVPIKGRNEINVKFDLAVTLAGSEKIEEMGIIITLDDIEQHGNYINVSGTYKFPEKRLCKSNSRFALQYFVVDGLDRTDTLEYRMPIVLDGEEYHETQLRRMAYKGERDPMFKYAEKTRKKLEAEGKPHILDENFEKVSWKDSIYLDDPDRFVLIPTKLWLEDYNRVYYYDTLFQDTHRKIKEMRFLDYTLEPYELNADLDEYKRRARRTKVDDARDLSLNFLPSSAKLDPNDSLGHAQLDGLKQDIYGIIRGESDGLTLKTLFVSGVASPEGSYEKNKVLAAQRMSFLSDQLLALIPRARQERMVKKFSSRVAGWDEVADLLWADSLKAEAEQLRRIIDKNPGSQDRQGAAIRNLPFYRTLIAERLPKLRTVKVEYNYEVFRELTPQEIYHRYRTDPYYTAPGTVLPLYEYYALFKAVDDPDELETLCRRALEAAKKSGDSWPLPANILAVSLIRRNVADTTLLAPYIDETKKCNQPWTDPSGRRYTKNPDAIVANQVVMMLKDKKYMRAVKLASMLPPKYDYLYSIARCLAGYKADMKTYALVSATSPRNKVIMDMAMRFMPRAKASLEKLDPDDPVSHYLKAQYYSRVLRLNSKDKYMNLSPFDDEPDRSIMMHALVKAFQMDESLIEIAETDAYILEDFYEEAVKVYKDPELLEIDYVIY